MYDISSHSENSFVLARASFFFLFIDLADVKTVDSENVIFFILTF